MTAIYDSHHFSLPREQITKLKIDSNPFAKGKHFHRSLVPFLTIFFRLLHQDSATRPVSRTSSERQENV
jgi:hypothetical protein